LCRLPHATFRIYAELNDFLPPARKMVEFEHQFAGTVSVKDMFESLGQPHTEVDLVLANGESVDFTYAVGDGDRISVYPIFEALDITPVLRVRPEPLRQVRFVLDTHLGKLAAYLRLLGFDSLYRNDYADEELAEISASEGRVLLTRDRGLLKRSLVTHGYCVRAIESTAQLGEVVRRFDLCGPIRPFGRCLRCNGVLSDVSREAVTGLLPTATGGSYESYRQGSACGKLYWRGAHLPRLQLIIEGVRGACSEPSY